MGKRGKEHITVVFVFLFSPNRKTGVLLQY